MARQLHLLGALIAAFGVAWTFLRGLVPAGTEQYIAAGSLIIIAFGLFLVVVSFIDHS